MKLSIIAAVAVVTLSGCGAAVEQVAQVAAPPQPPFTKIMDDCGVTTQRVVVQDEGASVAIDGPEDYEYLDNKYPVQVYEKAWTCLKEGTDMPASTENKIGNTRALDGMVEDSWGDYEATWTYHPDNGMDMTIEWTG